MAGNNDDEEPLPRSFPSENISRSMEEEQSPTRSTHTSAMGQLDQTNPEDDKKGKSCETEDLNTNYTLLVVDHCLFRNSW